MINLDEIQEILALHIKEKTKFKLQFFAQVLLLHFNKRQAPINDFIDKIYLGWFIRLLHNPKKYIKRVVSSFKLIKFFYLIFKKT